VTIRSIPITVIEELDKFKRDSSTLGRNAREASRLIDSCRTDGNLSKGVPLENGGVLRVMTNLGKHPPLPFPTLGKTADSLILATALMLRKEDDTPVVFVTRDTNLRLRADAVGLKAVSYEENTKVEIEEMYSGRKELKVSCEVVDDYLKNRTLDLSRIEELLATTGVEGGELLANQCVNLVDSANPEHEALGRFSREAAAIRPLARSSERAVHGIEARNGEQRIAFDLLLDDSVQIVTLVGKAGTGKTLLAIAAGMQKVATERAYTKLVVARPIMPLGKELGFLPGAVGEKLRPWMAPVFDNLELILKSQDASRRAAQSSSNDGDAKRKRRKRHQSPAEHTNKVIASGLLEVEPLTYIRGRSLPHQFLVIDEAQNLTHHEVKTIITRAGEGTKIVLTGDPYQIDNPFLDSATSGLTIAVERFKGQDVAGHVTLVQGERSELAELGSDLL